MTDRTEKGGFKEMLPKQGMLYHEDIPNMVLCKPKLLPLKSVTLEKLEKMQKEAQETVKEQEKMEEAQQAAMWAGVGSQGAGRVDYTSIHPD